MASLNIKRIERDILQTEYLSDDTDSRIERLNAVFVAQKTSGNYDFNKADKIISTGFQLGSVILLILSLIL